MNKLGQLHNSDAYVSVIKRTSDVVWSSETSFPGAATFLFIDGSRGWSPQDNYAAEPIRAIPLRSGK